MKQIDCYGKINLLLQVGPTRSDGFHEIFTVYQSISLHDTLTLELTKKSGVALTVSDATIPANEENIGWRAAESLMKRVGYSGGVRIHIEKRIPAGGGLGGGSSNGAAVMRLLNHLLGTPLSRDELAELAAGLGSDVPFFLTGGRAMGLGRGEQLVPLPDGPFFSFLAIFPPVPFYTKEMYRLLDRFEVNSLPSKRTRDEVLALLNRGPGAWENSFDRVVEKMSADVAKVMREIRDEGFPVMLSGSGSTFLVFEGPHSFEKIFGKLPSAWRRMRLHSLTRREALGDFIF